MRKCKGLANQKIGTKKTEKNVQYVYVYEGFMEYYGLAMTTSTQIAK